MTNIKDTKENVIPKEKIWQAIRWELASKELTQIRINTAYEKDDYFDLDLMLDKIRRFMKGEKSRTYFMHWCLILMNCFMSCCPQKMKSKLGATYYDIGDTFDAFAFQDGSPEDCRWLIAYLKWHAHCRENAINKTDEDFQTNGVVVYVQPDAYIENSNTDLYQILVVDKEEKKFNVFYVDGIDYLEHINYSQCNYDDSLIDIVCKRFSNCKLDPTLSLDYYKLKGD